MSDQNVKIPNKVTEEFKRRLSIKLLDELLEESELTDEDIDHLSAEVNREVRKRIEKDIYS